MQTPVPSLIRSLVALSTIIGKAEAHCAARKINPDVLFSDRLYPDMLPFAVQVMIACDHAKGAAARLSGTDNPKHDDTAKTFADLQSRIDITIDFLNEIPETAFMGCEHKTIHLKIAGNDMAFPAPVYLYSFALPNFYFHMTTAYNILRHNGVELGKGDFVGRP